MTKWRRLLFGVVRLALASAALGWLYQSGSISWTLMAGLLMNWPLTLAAASLFIISGVISGWRLCILLRPRGHELSTFDSARLTFIGLFFHLCVPGGAGADASRIYYASIGNAGWRTELATIIFLDRLSGMFALFLWPVLAAPLFPDLLAQSSVIRDLIYVAAVAALVMFVGMLLAMTDRFRYHAWLAWLFRRLPMGRNLEDVLATVHGYRSHSSALLKAAGVSLIIHTCSVMVTLIAAFAIDAPHFSGRIALLAPLGFLANALPFTPGGLGVGEAAFASLFEEAGIPGGPPVMLAWRAVSLVGGLLGCIFYLQGKRRMVHAASAVAYEPGT